MKPMPDIDLHQTYKSTGDSIHNLFDKNEEGFYVPLYQREYTWEEDNINQFFEDLVLGIQELSDGNDKAATFLGTVIFTNLDDKSIAVREGESNAEPTAVQLVIDGQQRISTIALLGIQITEHLKSLYEKLPEETPYRTLRNHCYELIHEKLLKLYTLKLGRGSNPPNKPKIISAKNDDRWTYDGDDNSYCSPVAHCIAVYIRTKDLGKAFEGFDPINGKRVRRNIELIGKWVSEICSAHVPDIRLHGQFPTGRSIVSKRMQKYVFSFTDDKYEEIEEIVGKGEIDESSDNYSATAIYHAFLLAYYLLHRCGVNRLQPTHEDWGFDMFQALNATGTPLTAMETFLPQVVRAEKEAGNDEWKTTQSFEYMEEIDEFFKPATSNEQKNSRTNELLGAFARCYEGKEKPLGNKFSIQRQWMTDFYEKKLPTLEEKHKFLDHLARVAKFFHGAWHMEDIPNCIRGLEKHDEKDLISFLVRYLKDAKSDLSAPILARFYSQALADKQYFNEFTEAVKACAAFFTLWRAAKSTSGLPDIYRRFSRKTSVVDGQYELISAKILKQYFLEILKKREIAEMDKWITESGRFLLYIELKTVCRFVLFLAGHDRVPDNNNKGLTRLGNKGVCPLLNINQWIAKDYKSLEHIAPANPPSNSNWEPGIYVGNKVHEVGNLLLLPMDINNSVDSKNWKVKFLHYSHVGTRGKEEVDKIRYDAKKEGVNLSNKAIKELSLAQYGCVVEPILNLGMEEGSWNAEIIDRRTRQIKEIAWKKLMSWLEDD